MVALLKEARRGREMIRSFGFGFFWLIFRRLFVSDRLNEDISHVLVYLCFDFPRTIIWTLF
jgi:hypothetical protein